jgi:galactokinase
MFVDKQVLTVPVWQVKLNFNKSSGCIFSRSIKLGAGWGGCAVSLIPETKLSEFLDQVNENYYSKNVRLKSKFGQAAFATKPSAGIFIIVSN